MSKASSVVASVTQQNNLGKEFHSLGPSTENARRPHELRRYDGTTSWWPVAERRWRLCTCHLGDRNILHTSWSVFTTCATIDNLKYW